MALGILGTKEGMTQVFDEETRKVVPVTIIHAAPNVILKQITADKNGYSAIQVAVGDKKATRMNRPDAGQFTAASEASGKTIGPKAVVREFRLSEDPGADLAVGNELTVGLLDGVKLVDVTGISKGKGTQGVMKRYNFKGFIRSHGTHEFFRHGGSIGTRLTPGHVLKGKKMPGRMGNEQVTTQNLTLFRVDAERNLLFIRGAVPGAKGGVVSVRPAVKKTGGKKW
ncbi:MAG: 50S ribosomal protein L3 [Deltaproteobacteria bacterium]|nr:50S ribosomal protein L3 [Deltaproteobacteria bacterium]